MFKGMTTGYDLGYFHPTQEQLPTGWLLHFLHPRKLTAGGPQNDALEKVTGPFKDGIFWGIDSLDFWSVMPF